jgi:hypothetical protein
MLLDGPPAPWLLTGLEVLLALTMAALLLGRWVTASSILATAIMAAGSGITYGFGKIDHNILLVLTPAVMALVGWSGKRQPSALAMHLWAFAIGLAMLSAGLVKALVGWLDTSTHAVRAALTVFTYLDDRHGPLAKLALNLLPPPAWELMDWATVLLECALVVSVLSWSWFRRVLAVLCIFHLAVGLMFGIVFAGNVVAYGAFVRWRRARLPDRVPPWAVLVLVSAAIVARYFLTPATSIAPPLVLIAGAAIALLYLYRSLIRPWANLSRCRARLSQ